MDVSIFAVAWSVNYEASTSIVRSSPPKWDRNCAPKRDPIL